MIKSGVNISGISPEIAIAYVITERIFSLWGSSAIITSALDSKHSQKSLHYIGHAIDLRTSHLSSLTLNKIISQLKESLGEQFDVILESDHLHIEFQPKR